MRQNILQQLRVGKAGPPLTLLAIILLSGYYQILAQSPDFISGVDISSLPQIEAGNGQYTENGSAVDPLQVFGDNGVNYVRLRLWHTPVAGATGLDATLAMAQRLATHNMGFLLDFHYSDTWADPANQTLPSAWQNISFDVLSDSVYQYTFDVISALRQQNTPPQIVQLGNEISCGFLWDDGRICDPFNTPQQWSQLATLLDAGAQAVRDAASPDDSIRIMIHSDRGGDNTGSRWFFDNLNSEDFYFDIIGLSYYPWWHGELQTMLDNAADLTQRYDKDVIIVETAYPWTLDWYDNQHNIVGDSAQLHSNYPASVDGQTAFLYDLMSGIREIPGQRGIGLFYWAPEWIPSPGFGSPWENLALFDFNGEALSTLTVFDSAVTSIAARNDKTGGFQLEHNFPNPFNPSTTIAYRLPLATEIELTIFDLTGRPVRQLYQGIQGAGRHTVQWDGLNQESESVASGIYMLVLKAENLLLTRKMILLR